VAGRRLSIENQGRRGTLMQGQHPGHHNPMVAAIEKMPEHASQAEAAQPNMLRLDPMPCNKRSIWALVL